MRKNMFPEILFVTKNLEQFSFNGAENIEDVMECETTMVATYQLLHIKQYQEQLKIVCID